MCILFVFTLLKVASYYYLSVLSMSAMRFQNERIWIEQWMVGVSSIQFFRLDFLTSQSP